MEIHSVYIDFDKNILEVNGKPVTWELPEQDTESEKQNRGNSDRSL